jgi:hypothetical protein
MGSEKWPDPTPEQLNNPVFEAIWQAIKTWDINVPDAYSGYCGATGNHVAAILKAINTRPAPTDAQRKALVEWLDEKIGFLDRGMELYKEHVTDGLVSRLENLKSIRSALAAPREPVVDGSTTPLDSGSCNQRGLPATGENIKGGV